MFRELWNIGLKVRDLEAEIDFLQRVGATMVLRETLTLGGQSSEYAILGLAGVRILLFRSVLFEASVEEEVRPGLTHAVYQVDDVDAEFERIKRLGGRVLVEPMHASGGFGSRRLAFFRSPGGFVFEVMQVLEDRLNPSAES